MRLRPLPPHTPTTRRTRTGEQPLSDSRPPGACPADGNEYIGPRRLPEQGGGGLIIEIPGVGLSRVVARLPHGLQNGALVAVAEGLQCDPQLHAALAVDVDKLVVLQLDDVAVLLGDDLGHPQQLAGAVGR